MSPSGAEVAKAVLPSPREPGERLDPPGGVLLEQAKGALMLHYRISALTASRVLETWAAAVGTTESAVVDALVHEVCRAERPAPGSLGAWLHVQLRHPCPVPDSAGPDLGPVSVTVDTSYSALQGVVTAARRAAARGVPLQISFPDVEHGAARAQLLQRLDLAVEIARAVEPGVLVRLPTDGGPH
jgi:hypothetical protein